MELKKIYLLHHSHLDIGFTHSQVVIEQLQTDFIDQALDLLDATADWEAESQPRWTIEVHQQLKLWLESATAENIERLKRHVVAGRLGLGAIQYNTTPLSSLESLCQQLVDVRQYREQFGFPVRAAFQHDVNGLPWIMSDLLLDAGVELFVMAINLHTGGNGPLRPGMFRWMTPRGRRLNVFSGNHYSAFDEITHPYKTDVAAMKLAMDQYWAMLQQLGYPYDFLYLSTTNLPIAYDNGGPSRITADKVREWNCQAGYPQIQYVTPEQLIDKLARIPADTLPEFRGDWNDFWNYGAGSTALETALNANTKQKLFGSALLGTHLPSSRRLDQLQARAWDRVILYDEHTWGAWASGSLTNHPFTVTTEGWKRATAHDGQEYARYVLQSRLSELAGNPPMFTSAGLLAVNPSPLKQVITLNRQRGWKEEIFGRLKGYTHTNADPTALTSDDDFVAGLPSGDLVHLEIEPFSAVRLPWTDCAAPSPAGELREGSTEEAMAIQVLDGHEKEIRTTGCRFIESEFHLLEYNPANGRITRLLDKQVGWDVLPPAADYNLFEPVHEQPDPRFDASRKSYYDRVVATEIRFQDCWNPDWKAARTGVSAFHGVRVEKHERSISLIREYSLAGAPRIIQRFELSADRPWIGVDILLHKDRNPSPEAIYFVSQLNLAEGWAATYDGAGVPVRLDDDQLDGSSKSWVTTEAFTRMEDDHHQFSVFAPGMPLVQIGGFHWGKPKDRIPRPARPLMVNWACNNYWETNFPVTQPGVIRFNCAIHTSQGETNAATYRLADGFARRPLFLPLATCERASSETLFKLDNPNVRLASLDRARYHDGWICRLVNPGSDAQTCTLALGAAPRSAAVVSPLEDVRNPIELVNETVTVDIPAQGIVSILVQR